MTQWVQACDQIIDTMTDGYEKTVQAENIVRTAIRNPGTAVAYDREGGKATAMFDEQADAVLVSQ